MILSLFTVLAFLSLAVLFFGFFSGQQHIRLIGFLFLFLLGMNALDGIDYKVGEEMNETSTVGVSNTSENSTVSRDTAYVYETFGNNYFGMFLAVLGAFGIIIDLVSTWRGGDEGYGREYQ